MATIVCPKCGFQQDAGPDCPRCGIIFARYRPVGRSRGPEGRAPDSQTHIRSAPGPFRRIYRVSRWVMLVGGVSALILILLPSPPPRVGFTPDSAQRAGTKLQALHAASQNGEAQTIELDESELNGWLSANLALQRPKPAAVLSTKKEDLSPALGEGGTTVPAPDRNSTVETVQSTVRDVKIELMGDLLKAYVAFNLQGKNMTLQLEGRLTVRDGYLRLEPTGGKLGSLPLLPGMLEKAARTLFESPENREKFRLPPGIRDVRVERGELVISSR